MMVILRFLESAFAMGIGAPLDTSYLAQPDGWMNH